MYHNDTNASVPYDLSILSTLEERQVRYPHFCSIPASLSLSLSLDWLSKADPSVPSLPRLPVPSSITSDNPLHTLFTPPLRLDRGATT